METELRCLFSQPAFGTLPSLFIARVKNSFGIWCFGAQNMIDDSRDLMSSSSRGLRAPSFARIRRKNSPK